ncbi:MAG: hypothetical protein ACFFDP_12235 [Promethearchaeota archaeon]
MSSQERDEHVSANPPDFRRTSNGSRCFAFAIVAFVLFAILFLFPPYLGFLILFVLVPSLLNFILIELVICLGILLIVFVMSSHHNWRQAIRRYFFGKEGSPHSSRTQISHATPTLTQNSFNTHTSQPILVPATFDSSSDYPDIKIWPTDVLPLNTVIQRLPTLESLVDELQEIIDSSSLQYSEVVDINREALLVKREATTLLLSSLIQQLKKKSIPLSFYLQKRKDLVKTLQKIEASLGSSSELEKAKPSSQEK